MNMEDLTLHIVSPDYYTQSGLPSAGMLAQPHDTDDERTYFIGPSSRLGPGWLTLVVPESDPRHAGMWTGDGVAADHYGWNIETRFLTPAEGGPSPWAVGDSVAPNTPETFNALPVGTVVNGIYPYTKTGPDEWTREDDGLKRTASAMPCNVPGDQRSFTIVSLPVEDRDGRRGTTPEATPEATEGPAEALPEVERTYTQAELDEALSAARREERVRNQRWIDSLVSDAHEFADESALCSEFDRFMTDHDLPARRRDYRVRLEVTGHVWTTVEAADEDEAFDNAREELDLSYLIVESVEFGHVERE